MGIGVSKLTLVPKTTEFFRLSATTMNLWVIQDWFRKERQTNERLGCLGEHLFAQLAGATTLDAVQFRVDPTSVPLCFCTHGRDFCTYSSAPSMVTSSSEYCEISPRRKPASVMSCCDWKPVGRNTRSLLSSFPCCRMRSTTYGTVEPECVRVRKRT